MQYLSWAAANLRFKIWNLTFKIQNLKFKTIQNLKMAANMQYLFWGAANLCKILISVEFSIVYLMQNMFYFGLKKKL